MNLLFLNISTTEILIILPLLVLFAYTLYDAIKNKNLTSNERILWILVILIGNLLGWLAYWLLGKKRALKY